MRLAPNHSSGEGREACGSSLSQGGYAARLGCGVYGCWSVCQKDSRMGRRALCVTEEDWYLVGALSQGREARLGK